MAGKGLDSVPTLRSVTGGLGGASRFKLEAYLRISYSITYTEYTLQYSVHRYRYSCVIEFPVFMKG